MIRFSEYYGGASQVDKFNFELTVISKSALERRLFEKTNQEYAFLFPNKSNINTLFQIRDCFKRLNHGLYPIACKEHATPFRSYLLTKKPRTTSEDFRKMIMDVYQSLNSFDVIYSNGNLTKTVKNDVILESSGASSLTKFQKLATELRGKKCEILGIETPLNNDLKEQYHNNALMICPLSEEEFRYAKNWKMCLNG